MGKVIAFANQKGGVGKSTLTVQAAFYLRKHRKKKVLVIDIDSQGNTTESLTQGQPYTATSSTSRHRPCWVMTLSVPLAWVRVCRLKVR